MRGGLVPASAGRVDGGDFVDLVKNAHGELGAELHSLVDAGVADVAFDQRDEHHRERGAESVDPRDRTAGRARSSISRRSDPQGIAPTSASDELKPRRG